MTTYISVLSRVTWLCLLFLRISAKIEIPLHNSRRISTPHTTPRAMATTLGGAGVLLVVALVVAAVLLPSLLVPVMYTLDTDTRHDIISYYKVII